MKFLILITLVMSLISFISMGWDKKQAKAHAWRVPEKTLFLLALLLGAPGGTLGMWLFRHKTKHWYFALGFPLIAIVQLFLLAFLAKRFM